MFILSYLYLPRFASIHFEYNAMYGIETEQKHIDFIIANQNTSTGLVGESRKSVIWRLPSNVLDIICKSCFVLIHLDPILTGNHLSIRKSGRRWYDQAEFITAGLAGGRCSDLVKEYNVI